jgi:D-serine dehydratase
VPYFVYPLIVLGALVLLLGTIALLARIQGGRFLRPVVMQLAKVPFVRKLMTKASAAALERQNPDLASAIKKIERAGGTRDPQRAQAALARLSPAERKAYMDAAAEQGVLPPTDTLGRAERRRLERAQRQMKRGR